MDSIPEQWLQQRYSRYSVLIIEDDDDFRRFLSELLKASGFRVLQADSGHEGILCYQQDEPDLVITDIVMPGTDGLDVISKIKELSPLTPIVAMADLQDKPHKQSFLSLAVTRGADAVLAKPFNINTLRDTLQRLLDSCHIEPTGIADHVKSTLD